MTRFEADEGALAATEAADAAAFSGTVEWQGILAATEAADTPLRRRRRRQLRMRMQGGLLSMDEAAAKLGCSIKTLNGHVASGALRYVNIGHGRSARAKCSPTPISTQFIAKLRPERTFHVHLPQPALAVLAFRLPVARSSISRLHESHQPARSAKK